MPEGMPNFGGVVGSLVLIAISATAGIAQEPAAEDDYEKEVARAAQRAESFFEEWKKTGILSEEFLDQVVRGERPDLQERVLAGDRLEEITIHPHQALEKVVVTVRDLSPVITELKESDYTTVWRRITKDRFEIWTPTSGELFDATGEKISEARVSRGDGWGREWYGAFLPDGRWVTTDLDELDNRLSFFSAKGKKLKVIKGDTLIPPRPDEQSIPLIGWARSDKQGKGWIVSIGSEEGRGWVRVTPEGKFSRVTCPWKECFPQQLGKRGMYTSLQVMSDDGTTKVTHNEAGHGMWVGWPSYEFPSGKSLVIPDGERFGILSDNQTIYVEDSYNDPTSSREEREGAKMWFFTPDGKCLGTVPGTSVGASLKSGGLWIRLMDDSSLRVDQGKAAGARLSFITEDQQPLIPVELHDDIGLGLFLKGEELALGTWKNAP